MTDDKRRELEEMTDEDLLALAHAHRTNDLTFRDASFDWKLITSELQRRPHLLGRF